MRALMPGTNRLLIVEGYSDKRFFLGLQRHIEVLKPFDVRFPGDQNRHPGKAEALKGFNLWLQEAAEPGRYKAIGVCVDADYSPNGGFSDTDAAIKTVLANANFRMVNAAERLYQHITSGSRASYWILPSHANDGYLEALALSSLTEAELNYLDRWVTPFIASLSPSRFSNQNQNRAILYTYLAIQRKPDKSLPTLLDDQMIDLTKPDIAALKSWLIGLFETAE